MQLVDTPGKTYRTLSRIEGTAFDSGEPFLAWVSEGEQVVEIEPDHSDRGYWLRTADGGEVLVDGDPMSLLVTDEEWQRERDAEEAYERRERAREYAEERRIECALDRARGYE